MLHLPAPQRRTALPLPPSLPCRRFDGVVPGPSGDAGAAAIAALGEKVAALVDAYTAALEAIRMKEALKAAMLVSKAGNAFFQASPASVGGRSA